MKRPRRFDLALMRPPVAGSPVEPALLRRVRDWCEVGTLPLRIACIAPDDGLDAVACELDGSHRLARLGRWRGLAWRLRVLVDDHRPRRARRADDPWDCGWWRDDLVSTAAAFRPRRPTLLLVREPEAAQVEALVATFTARCADLTVPLRLLFVSTDPLPGLVRL